MAILTQKGTVNAVVTMRMLCSPKINVEESHRIETYRFNFQSKTSSALFHLLKTVTKILEALCFDYD